MFKISDLSSFLINRTCHVIEHHGDSGFTFHVNSVDGVIKACDWRSDELANLKAVPEAAVKSVLSAAAILLAIKVPACRLHITSDGVLVDAFVDGGAAVSPGMLHDLFSKSLPTQRLIAKVSVDQSVIDAIVAGDAPYSGDLVIKPAVPATVAADGGDRPAYVEVIRNCLDS